MKRMSLLLAGMAMTSASFAQFSLGVQATGNLSTAQVKLEDAGAISKKMKIQPGGGIVARYQFSENLALQSGIHYLQNGVKATTTGIDPENIDLGTITMEASSSLHYAQLPLQVLYFIAAGNTKFYVAAGPFASYGFSGKTKLSGTYTMPNGQPQKVSQSQDAFKKESDGGAGFKRFDWGAAAVAGVQFQSGLFIQAGYQLSISDIDAGNASVYKNRSAQLGIGYFFTGK